MVFKYKFIISAIFCAFSLSACGGESGSNGATSSTPPPPPPPPPPPTNDAPVFSGSFSFAFDEGSEVLFNVEATDPENSAVTFSIEMSEDFSFFTIDESTGEITGRPRGDGFDFENPLDGNSDNIYNLTIIASDGTNTSEQPITVIIQDLEGPLTCTTGEQIEVLENTEGVFYTLTAEKPDAILQSVFFGPERSITRSSGEDVPDEFSFALSGFPNADNVRVAEFKLALSHYLNAETLGNLDDTFTFAVEAELNGEIADCSVEIKVVDVENEVVSGVKLSGLYPEIFGFEHEEIGDIDGDGLTDFWLSSGRSRVDLPPDHEGHVILGSTMETVLRQLGPEEVLISELSETEFVKIRGSFPSVLPGRRFIGNTLTSHPIGDVDGDGRPELLLALNTSIVALESSFADRPLAYLIWGDALLAQPDGLIDLNNLLPSEGIALEGLGGMNRQVNTAISGDFDGDGIDDIAIRLPLGEIRASDTSVYRAPTFFVFGDFLRASKGVSSIDLLGDVADIDPNEIVILTTESSTLSGSPDSVSRPFPLNGHIIEAFSDVDGDGASEIIGTASLGQSERVGVLSSNFIKSAKGQKGLILYRDVPDEDVDLIEGAGDIILSDRHGDFDGDDIDDLLFISTTGSLGSSSATLLKGRALQANSSSLLIENTPTEDIINFVSNDDIEQIIDVSFIPDVDGDSRDDIVLSYTNIITVGGELVSIDKIVLVLAHALDGHPSGEVFELDNMSPGEGLHFINSSIQRRGGIFSTLSDVDGDDIPDLLISPSHSIPREAFLVPGSDIRTALNSDSIVFDLNDRFRAPPE